MKKAVFLDRDGVINNSMLVNGIPTPPRSLEQLEILSGVAEGIELLHSAGFELIVVSNQPDVSRGKMSKQVVDKLNIKLKKELNLKHFYICFHDEVDNCSCRKPKPGLIRKAALDLKINLRASFMVGDRWKDIAAGQAVGCRCFFIDNSYIEKQPSQPYTSVPSLIGAAQLILKEINDEIGR